MSIGQEIKRAREKAGLNRVQLGRAVGVAHTTIKNWEDDAFPPRKRYHAALVKTLGLPLSTFNQYGGSVVLVPPGVKRISIKLLEWSDLKMLRAGQAVKIKAKFIEVEDDPSLSPDRIALRVIDDSMNPEFTKGELIFIDPTQTDPMEDEVVVARLKRENHQTIHVLRRYLRPRAGGFDLVADNPKFDTYTVSSQRPADILGILVEHHKKIYRKKGRRTHS